MHVTRFPQDFIHILLHVWIEAAHVFSGEADQEGQVTADQERQDCPIASYSGIDHVKMQALNAPKYENVNIMKNSCYGGNWNKIFIYIVL